MKKLAKEVTVSGDILTQMFNFICMKGTYAEVAELVGAFNKEVEPFLEEVDINEETMQVEKIKEEFDLTKDEVAAITKK